MIKKNGLITYSNGTKYWHINDLYHRVDGPAVVDYNKTKHWFINGLRHREDGPAIEWIDGYSQWWLNGKYISCKSNEEFLRIVKLKAFL